MTAVEGICGLIASVIAILGGMTFAVRYLARHFDEWASAVIENSTAVRDLSRRVTALEGTIRKQ